MAEAVPEEVRVCAAEQVGQECGIFHSGGELVQEVELVGADDTGVALDVACGPCRSTEPTGSWATCSTTTRQRVLGLRRNELLQHRITPVLTAKRQYIKDKHLAGVMMYSLEADDLASTLLNAATGFIN
jgi:hypothetical protein